jgi:hypothetical protein
MLPLGHSLLALRLNCMPNNISIRYEPWSLRGYEGDVWQVYVDITGSHTLQELREVKEQMNNPAHKGLHIAENKSRALERLGWEKWDERIYYKYFR